jgi:hypothetical protein
MGNGDLLNRQLPVTLGANVDLVDDGGAIESVPAADLAFTILAVYVDEATDGIAAFAISPATLEVE